MFACSFMTVQWSEEHLENLLSAGPKFKLIPPLFFQWLYDVGGVKLRIW